MRSTNVLTPLSGNILKIIAAVCMLCDHIGVIFFPYDFAWRIVGRLAFPIFAFFIAEGCKHTKNRTKYLAMLAGMAALFQIVYTLVMDGSLYTSIFVTFSVSIALIYLLDECKKAILDKKGRLSLKIGWSVAFVAAVVAVWGINQISYRDFYIDYGFWGIMTPVFASFFHAPKDAPTLWKSLDEPYISALAISIPLLFLAIESVGLGFPQQYYAFLAIPLLLLYSGKRGKWKMKYFFYIFYPAHLVILYGIALLL